MSNRKSGQCTRRQGESLARVLVLHAPAKFLERDTFLCGGKFHGPYVVESDPGKEGMDPKRPREKFPRRNPRHTVKSMRMKSKWKE